MEELRDDSVSSYPWKVNSKQKKIVKASAAPHVSNIRQELIDRLASVAAAEMFSAGNKRRIMISTFWIVQRLRGAILKEIGDALAHFGITETPRTFVSTCIACGWPNGLVKGNTEILSTTIHGSTVTPSITHLQGQRMIPSDLRAM
jgi:hypothetical protein